MTDTLVGEMPKASIGNYKGVMLCNRPDNNGQQRRPERTGPPQFYPRVDVKNANPLGWNPCTKVLPRAMKKRNVLKEILTKHKSYLKNLEEDRRYINEAKTQIIIDEEERRRTFMEKAQQQRQKIYQMKKQDELYKENIEAEFQDEKTESQPAKLT